MKHRGEWFDYSLCDNVPPTMFYVPKRNTDKSVESLLKILMQLWLFGN